MLFQLTVIFWLKYYQLLNYQKGNVDHFNNHTQKKERGREDPGGTLFNIMGQSQGVSIGTWKAYCAFSIEIKTLTGGSTCSLHSGSLKREAGKKQQQQQQRERERKKVKACQYRKLGKTIHLEFCQLKYELLHGMPIILHKSLLAQDFLHKFWDRILFSYFFLCKLTLHRTERLCKHEK